MNKCLILLNIKAWKTRFHRGRDYLKLKSQKSLFVLEETFDQFVMTQRSQILTPENSTLNYAE